MYFYTFLVSSCALSMAFTIFSIALTPPSVFENQFLIGATYLSMV